MNKLINQFLRKKKIVGEIQKLLMQKKINYLNINHKFVKSFLEIILNLTQHRK